MPADPPRETVHKMQHMLLDGLRILRDRTAPNITPEALAGLDRAIAELMPMEGFTIQADARNYAMAHGLRVLCDDIVDHVVDTHVDPSEFPETLRRIEAELLVIRDQKLAEKA